MQEAPIRACPDESLAHLTVVVIVTEVNDADRHYAVGSAVRTIRRFGEPLCGDVVRRLRRMEHVCAPVVVEEGAKYVSDYCITNDDLAELGWSRGWTRASTGSPLIHAWGRAAMP